MTLLRCQDRGLQLDDQGLGPQSRAYIALASRRQPWVLPSLTTCHSVNTGVGAVDEPDWSWLSGELVVREGVVRVGGWNHGQGNQLVLGGGTTAMESVSVG